jgi:predicted O-methyltransferase YrrM
MIEKVRTLAWFAARPGFWPHAAALGARRLSPSRDTPEHRAAAAEWAAARAVPVREALATIGVGVPDSGPPRLPEAILDEARTAAAQSPVRMGGPGDLDLLFAAVRLSGARRAVETGVAYGWSSLAILAAMEDGRKGRLASVDMPYPKMANEAFVGCVVPERLRGGWTLIRQPDRFGLDRAISSLEGRIDLAHYDSDKSWQGRRWAYPRLWTALRPGGLFISDDIQDNMAFAEMVDRMGLPFAVTESGGKFVGLLKKPGNESAT